MGRRPLLAAACLALGALSFEDPAPRPPAPPACAAYPAPPAALRLPPEAAAVARHLARFQTGLAGAEHEALARTIVAEARRHGFSPELILAVISVESGHYNFAVSRVKAIGLMQILPTTGEEVAGSLGVDWYGAQTLFDPEANVRLGTAYLRQLVNRYGRIDVALAAYNWGPGHIDRRLRHGEPLPVSYARRVLDVYGSTPPTGESRS